MSVSITAIYGAFNAVLSVALAANVTRVRAKTEVFLGTASSEDLLRAVRRHGNNAEYVPLALVMLLVAELAGGRATVLHAFGALLSVGRITHAIGVGAKPSPLRAIGAVMTWVMIISASIYAVMLAH